MYQKLAWDLSFVRIRPMLAGLTKDCVIICHIIQSCKVKKIEVYVTKQGEYTILNLMKKSVSTVKNQI